MTKKAVKAAYDDLEALLAGLRSALLGYQTANAPDKKQLGAIADRARGLARRRRTTLLGSIVISDSALSQVREDLNKIADDLDTAAGINDQAVAQGLLSDALNALTRAQSDVPKPKPLLQKLKEQFTSILRGNANAATRPEPQVKPALNIEAILSKAQAKFNAEGEALAKQVSAGELTVEQWRQAMMRALRDLHYTGAVTGAGGIGNLTPDALARIDAKMQEQGKFLNQWANQLEKRNVPLQEAELTRRAKLYAGAVQATVNEIADAVLYRKFPMLPCYPVDGHTLCRGSCKCRTWKWNILDDEKGDADVWYRLTPAEHCATCLYRAEVFSPLQIRDFKIVTPYDPQRINHL